ncbi:pyridoxal-dependent decarboxylase domain protein [Lasiosphaeria hispida]|uniref:Pyridoxal-dependent decarboxylase domain protein n=1 Tax=Lasiosphaeria hispida TaxID=260671 RepID=A0AAJ0MBA3_9PEZI|nr:pyridoxal-dependent decarboxylase domain protein [Lasiosphaeria hispida]
MASGEDISHQAISSWFIGPRAENLPEFRSNITALLDELQLAREDYFKEDENGYEFISEGVRDSAEFKRVTAKVAKAVRQTAKMLGKHSVPFYHPRYQAHMCTDLSMPAMLGYFMTMIYNPNNVAIEASPISTVAEIEVGEQLCDLFGFNGPDDPGSGPAGWGHITCDGTVANLESIWVARNLKFYPLAVRKAMDDDDGPLRFVPETFNVRTCQGKLKPFRDLSTWELLNLKPKTILDIPEQLHTQFGITPTFLQSALDSYNVQTTGKDVLERHFNLATSPSYLIPSTKHYSWPKGAAITGIGSAHAVSIPVDDAARLDLAALEARLAQSLASQTPVYAVVAVIGSTEEGAVDPLRGVLALRQRFQAQGLSFAVHADAAWGGYFATMLPRGAGLGRDGGVDGLVPDLSLRVETQEDLFAMRYCDSVTVDPHKAGYIPYPAGALVYRDGRLKNLVTWTSPYLSRGSETSIGIYGVEGSKPGAAAVSTWLSNQCLGLNQQGYGALLSEACFTSSRFSALWAALATPEDSFTCVPFNMLPSEATGDPKLIEEEKQRIRHEVLAKTNAEIVANDAEKPLAEKTITLLRALGSDLNINAFALNWRYPDGTLNRGVEEANYLMTRVVKRLSVESPDDKPTKIPLYLTSTEFEPDLYGECAATFKKRLGLDDYGESLMVLRNVVMSPFASLSAKGDFINMLGDTFKQVIEEEVKVCQVRNEATPDYHSFLIHGTDKIFLSYRSMFHVAKHRRQIILAVEFDEAGAKAYRELKGNTEEEIVLKTSEKINLAVRPPPSLIISNLTLTPPFPPSGVIHPRLRTTIHTILKNRPLTSAAADPSYPSALTPFYLYGTPREPHLDHILTRAPNIALSAGAVALALHDSPALDLDGLLARGAILVLDGVHEAAMQPVGEDRLGEGFFFRGGRKFGVRVWEDPLGPAESGRGLVGRVVGLPPVATGSVTLGEEVVVDVEKVNRDPWGEKEGEKLGRWRERFARIGREMEG